jgi:hypothetical protein
MRAGLRGQIDPGHPALTDDLEPMAARFRTSETTPFLAELSANHEKDAYMLRALLWEAREIRE